MLPYVICELFYMFELQLRKIIISSVGGLFLILSECQFEMSDVRWKQTL